MLWATCLTAAKSGAARLRRRAYRDQTARMKRSVIRGCGAPFFPDSAALHPGYNWLGMWICCARRCICATTVSLHHSWLGGVAGAPALRHTSPDETQCNPGVRCSVLPGFRCAASGLQLARHVDLLREAVHLRGNGIPSSQIVH